MPGTKSKNTAESTGRLPPTPTPMTANSDAKVRKLFDPPAARPKVPAIRSVILKDHLRYLFHQPSEPKALELSANLLPQISHPSPQKTAPTNRPMFKASDKKGPWNWNSDTTGARINPPRSCV